MRKLSLLLSSIVVISTTTSCSIKISKNEITPTVTPKYTDSYTENISFDEYESSEKEDKGYVLDKDFIKAMEDFAFTSASKLLVGENKNLCYSPVSLYMALGIIGLGADGTTEKEILSALGLSDKSDYYLAEQSRKLFRFLNYDNGVGKIKTANSLWLKEDLTFNEAFLNKIGKSIFASLYRVDFADARTSELMRDWISDNTMGTLTPEIGLDSDQIMSILNTIYFKDEWIDRFVEEEAKQDTFYLSDGSTVECDFMNSTYVAHGFTRGEGYIASSLYLKNNGRMIFILPDEGITIESLLSTPESAAALFRGGKNFYGKIAFQIPKFSYGTDLELGDSLEAMGVKAAFNEEADFSRLTEEKTFLSNIRQQTHMAIDEKGVEAAAFTNVYYLGSAPARDDAVEMILNRPFIFAIEYKDNLLFIGVVNNPNEK